MASVGQRHHMAHLMELLVHYEPQIHYLQRRPMHTQHMSEAMLELYLKHGIGLAMDCSESSTLIARLAGLHDPCNNHYNGWGNTDSMYANPHMRHYHDAKLAGVGAFCIFGTYPDTHHVGLVHRPDPHGGDPEMFSHGQEKDPRFMPFSWLRDYFRTYTFLSIAKL